MSNLPTSAALPPSRPAPLDPELEAQLTHLETERQRRAQRQARIWKERRILLPALAIALFLLPNFRMAQVVDRSMLPEFHEGDRLVVLKSYRLLSPLKVGDVVVIHKMQGKLAGEEIVKRVVFIQNAEGNAPWPETIRNSHGRWRAGELFEAEVSGKKPIPPHALYVLGDNVEISTDSRDFGPVFDYEVLGKVIYQRQ